jgi:DDE superfamily endonuclease
MNGVALKVPNTGIPTLVPYDQGIPFSELCEILFASMSRSDQRCYGAQYLQGLLAVEGRKSTRNLATWPGTRANEQSLHHFINSSSWEWTPVRQALAGCLMRLAPPEAWVMHPLLIPKAGRHSVGVDRRFVRSIGKMLNSQQTVGVWAASERLNCPISWRLLLSEAWLGNTQRRVRASIPEAVHVETLGDGMAEMALELARDWHLPALPVILDARETDAMWVVRRLRSAHLPVLARIDGNLPLQPADPSLRALTPQALSARALMGLFKDMRRAVTWSPDASGVVLRTSLVATARVQPPGRSGSREDADLLLLGAGEQGRHWPAQLWLTNLTDAQPGPLFRMTGLLRQVERDVERIGDTVGLRDFTGRSFGGWHRHVTMASAAYAVTALGGAPMSWAPRDLAWSGASAGTWLG